MFDLLKNIVQGGFKKVDSPEENEKNKQIAACVLLLEAAHVDDECTPEEMDHVVSVLHAKLGISMDYVDELMALAHAERKNAVDLWKFSNHINQTYSMAEKIAIMEDVWRIIHADGKLDMHEDHFAHKLANLLRLTHKQLIDAKLAARNLN
ncbi:MAG: TerB family tellurite resistance protein [Desulfobulbaceae bacterium]|nr:TerB family tellurite resistance protein [Desulfobulbaceae bacterium]